MDAEELLKNIEGDDLILEDTELETKRERLAAVVAGGRSKQYLGKAYQLSDIDAMTPEQINKLYCKYEARLGINMTKTLGNSFLTLYSMGVSKYFNIDTSPKLIEDLEEDPFVNHALNRICCELYYKYGWYLAPLTLILTTMRHIEFDFKTENENINLENDE